MGNPEHMKWLSEGADAWNERRRRAAFKPNFESEDIARLFDTRNQESKDGLGISFIGIDLSNANLRGATLGATFLSAFGDSSKDKVDLTDAKFPDADLTRAEFFRANLTDANFSAANLSGTRFWECDLTNAVFSWANLRGAQFRECNFEGANLFNTSLIGADFIDSKLWEAALFPPVDQGEVSPEVSYNERIDTIDDLLKACRDFIRRTSGSDIVLYFRGQPCSWPLSPSVTRESALRSTEGEMLNDLMTRQPEAFNGLRSALAQWVLAQHHGLKTRLLDITRNPLVALFYSCNNENYLDKDGCLHVFGVPRSLIKPFNSDTVSILANLAKLSRGEQDLLLGKIGENAMSASFLPFMRNMFEGRGLFARANHRLYYAIRQEKPSFEEQINPRDLFRVFVVEPQRMFERIRAQSGAFIISAFHERFERDEVLKWNKDIPIYSHYVLSVPRAKKEALLEDLRLLNVTQETLFPSVDEAASAITQQYRDRADQIR